MPVTFIELIGYIKSVSPAQSSRNNNTFFGTQVKTEGSTSKVRVMCNYNTKRNLFVSKCESKSPIKLSCLSPTATGLIFYNSNIGSRITDVPGVTFKYVNTEKISMKNIADIAPKNYH